MKFFKKNRFGVLKQLCNFDPKKDALWKKWVDRVSDRRRDDLAWLCHNESEVDSDFKRRAIVLLLSPSKEILPDVYWTGSVGPVQSRLKLPSSLSGESLEFVYHLLLKLVDDFGDYVSGENKDHGVGAFEFFCAYQTYLQHLLATELDDDKKEKLFSMCEFFHPQEKSGGSWVLNVGYFPLLYRLFVNPYIDIKWKRRAFSLIQDKLNNNEVVKDYFRLLHDANNNDCREKMPAELLIEQIERLKDKLSFGDVDYLKTILYVLLKQGENDLVRCVAPIVINGGKVFYDEEIRAQLASILNNDALITRMEKDAKEYERQNEKRFKQGRKETKKQEHILTQMSA